jgi:rod shape-determining protein MreD
MREWMLPLICSAIIVVIQIIFAPILTIFSVVPSFVVAFVLVLSVLRKPDSTYGYAFVLGLIADLLSQTPVGLTSLLLLAITFVLSRVFEVLDDTSITMPLIAFAAAIFVFEFVFMLVLLIVGYQGVLAAGSSCYRYERSYCCSLVCNYEALTSCAAG